MALALHFSDFSMSSDCYQHRLAEMNLSNLRSRRCATCLVSFLKMHLGLMHVEPGYFCFKNDLDTRTSNRFADDFVVLRNYQSDERPHVVRIHTPSFKTNFFYRVVSNYNSLRGDFEPLGRPFNQLKKLLQLLNFDRAGLVVSD